MKWLELQQLVAMLDLISEFFSNLQICARNEFPRKKYAKILVLHMSLGQKGIFRVFSVDMAAILDFSVQVHAYCILHLHYVGSIKIE